MHDSGRAATSTARMFAWSGAVVFVLSLGYFLYSFWMVFGQPADGPFRAGALVWNVALFSGFALHHSLFAREPVRRTLARALPRLERSLYVWIASVLLALVCALWQPLAGVVWRLDGVARIAAGAVQIAGMILSVYSAGLIDVWELAGVRQPRPEAVEFKTTGPYGLVRHPIYLGWFLIVFAAGTMTMTRFVFAVASGVYILVAIPFEERSLRASAGVAYERYATQVRWKLIPRVY